MFNLIAIVINLIFIICGFHLISVGHPFWGVLLILLGFPKITFGHVDDGKSDIHIIVKGVNDVSMDTRDDK